MKKGAPKKELSSVENALERVGFGGESSKTFADVLIERGMIRLPKLPVKASSGINQMQFEAFIRAVLNGMSTHKAAGASGIVPLTARRWLKAGRKDAAEGLSTAQAMFYLAFNQAEAVTEELLTQTVMLHAQTDWRAAHVLLRDRYGLGKQPQEELLEQEAEAQEQERRERLRQSLPQHAEPPAIVNADGSSEEAPAPSTQRKRDQLFENLGQIAPKTGTDEPYAVREDLPSVDPMVDRPTDEDADE